MKAKLIFFVLLLIPSVVGIGKLLPSTYILQVSSNMGNGTSGNASNPLDVWVNTTGDTMTGALTMSTTNAIKLRDANQVIWSNAANQLQLTAADSMTFRPGGTNTIYTNKTHILANVPIYLSNGDRLYLRSSAHSIYSRTAGVLGLDSSIQTELEFGGTEYFTFFADGAIFGDEASANDFILTFANQYGTSDFSYDINDTFQIRSKVNGTNFTGIDFCLHTGNCLSNVSVGGYDDSSVRQSILDNITYHEENFKHGNTTEEIFGVVNNDTFLRIDDQRYNESANIPTHVSNLTNDLDFYSGQQVNDSIAALGAVDTNFSFGGSSNNTIFITNADSSVALNISSTGATKWIAVQRTDTGEYGYFTPTLIGSRSSNDFDLVYEGAVKFTIQQFNVLSQVDFRLATNRDINISGDFVSEDTEQKFLMDVANFSGEVRATCFGNATHCYNISDFLTGGSSTDTLWVLNSTTIFNNSGTATINETWLIPFIDNWFTGKDTDDLAQGTGNLYDNQSWNESRANSLYIRNGTSVSLIDGTFSGTLSIAQNLGHIGDSNTAMQFLNDQVRWIVGGSTLIDLVDGTVQAYHGINTTNATVEYLCDNSGNCGNVTDFLSGTAYTNGSGVSIDGTEINHSDTSSVSDSDNSGLTFIQDITFDTFGHSLSIATGEVTQTLIAALGFLTADYFDQDLNTTSDVVHNNLNATGNLTAYEYVCFDSACTAHAHVNSSGWLIFE